jgi:hypothetical protein
MPPPFAGVLAGGLGVLPECAIMFGCANRSRRQVIALELDIDFAGEIGGDIRSSELSFLVELTWVTVFVTSPSGPPKIDPIEAAAITHVRYVLFAEIGGRLGAKPYREHHMEAHFGIDGRW